MTKQTSHRSAASGTPNIASLDSRLDKRLMGYVAAAGAAGVAVLAPAQPAAARIVYTKTDIALGANSSAAIDLNGNGTADITFTGVSVGSYGVNVSAWTPTGNGVFKGGAPEPFGVAIGKNGQFTTQQFQLVHFTQGVSGTIGSGGPWAGATSRYLGLKFEINGETHFGWIRLTVKYPAAKITGYAYETVTEKTIRAGDTGIPSADEADVVPSPADVPASLGLLARGADAISVWRRE
jgi:hypothetical protein